MNIPPRIRKLLEKRLEGVRFHLVAGPDGSGWAFLTNAKELQDELLVADLFIS